MTNKLAAAASLCALVCLAATAVYADEGAAKAPSVVVGRTTGSVVSILVDVTDAIAANDPKSAADASLKRVELLTLDALDKNAARLPKHAKRARVSVIYQKTGAVSPIYKTATFTGVERLLTLNVGTSAKERAAAHASIAGDKASPGLVTVTGQLPPASP